MSPAWNRKRGSRSRPKKSSVFFVPGGPIRTSPSPARVDRHSPHRVDAERPLADVGRQAQGQAAQRGVGVAVDEDAGLGLGVVEGPRLAPGDAVHGVDDAVRLQAGLELGRVPVVDPEVVQMGDVGPQLDDDSVDDGVPFEGVLRAEAALRLRPPGRRGRRPSCRRRRGRACGPGSCSWPGRPAWPCGPAGARPGPGRCGPGPSPGSPWTWRRTAGCSRRRRRNRRGRRRHRLRAGGSRPCRWNCGWACR